MEEIWKDIKGYESLYQISNKGKVRSLDRMLRNTLKSFRLAKGKPVAITDNGKGYKIASLSKNGRKNHYVHRLVADHFIEKIEGQIEVNHKDLNKSNNFAENLEWVSRLQNNNHAIKNGAVPLGGDKHNAISIMNKFTKETFGCIREAADHYNVNYDLLIQAMDRKRKGAKSRNHLYISLIEIKK